jgi:hypothetical protein
MKLYVFVFVGIALSATGCAEKEQATPPPADEAPTMAPTVETPAVEAPVAVESGSQNATFLEHMHRHAERIDDLNLALADGDLESAKTPAYWLSRHEAVSGIQAEWQPYVTGMREAARAVEAAPDLATARAAAERITAQCQGCHEAAGIMGN